MASRHLGLALSKHIAEKYTDAMNFLSSVMANVRHMAVGSDGKWKPIQTGIILTTQAVLEMADELLVNANDFLLTGRLSQDCLENLFSTIRLKTPTPLSTELRNSFRVRTVSQYMKAANSSYDTSDAEYLADYLIMKQDEKKPDDEAMP